MGRILAIDYGTKRVGLAVTDPLKIIATGLDTVHSKDVISYLKNYIQSEPVELYVVGMPVTLTNEESRNARHVKQFVLLLKKNFPAIPIEFEDERFTSSIAQDAMLRGGMKKKDRQNKSNIDKISAVVILQSFLERMNL